LYVVKLPNILSSVFFVSPLYLSLGVDARNTNRRPVLSIVSFAA
jgi:hypothetical protein